MGRGREFGQRRMTGESLFRRLRWPGVVESFVEPRVRIPSSPVCWYAATGSADYISRNLAFNSGARISPTDR